MPAQLKFITDEGVEREIVMVLRKTHDEMYVAETMKSETDDFILGKAVEENRILITLDKDFGELAYRQRLVHAGVILCRLQKLPIEEAVALIEATITQYSDELKSAFTVIQPRNIRIRKQ